MRVLRDTTSEAYRDIVKDLYNQEPQGSRYGGTKEIIGVTVRSQHPRERMFLRPGINWAFGLQESFAYWNGMNPGHVERYNPKMEDFMYTGDGEDVEQLHGSAYGRYFRYVPHDQITRVLNTLRENPDSRRCIINVHQAGVEDYDRGDVACTVYLHPIIRDGQLNMIACLRSQDMLWGYPYDVQAFQWVQEVLAGILGVDLGWYEHRMNSCHYYVDREDEIKTSVEEHESLVLPDSRLGIDDVKSVMLSMQQGLKRTRDGKIPHEEIDYLEDYKRFYADWLRTMTSYEQRRFHDDTERAKGVAQDIKTDAFHEYLQFSSSV